jgi:hypothetical protein
MGARPVSRPGGRLSALWARGAITCFRARAVRLPMCLMPCVGRRRRSWHRQEEFVGGRSGCPGYRLRSADRCPARPPVRGSPRSRPPTWPRRHKPSRRLSKSTERVPRRWGRCVVRPSGQLQIIQLGRISLHAGHVPADQFDGFIQSVPAPARDEDVSFLCNEQLGTGQRHTA